MFTALIRFAKIKLMRRKSEIRLGLVFKPFNQEKRRRLLDRVRKIIMAQKQDVPGLGRGYDQNPSSLIFASDDEDIDEDENYSYAKAPVNRGALKNRTSLGAIVKKNKAGLIDES